MKIAIIGGGYVGLVSAACFAEFGVAVAVVEADENKRRMLLAGGIPIYEPGLDRLVAENMAAGRLTFPATLQEGIADAEAVFIAVGTPTRRGDGHADLTYVFAAVEQVVKSLDHPAVIVTKSTVPVGTGLDGRIGRKFLHPGPGFGGSCFPKDTLALMRIAEEAGAPSRLIQSVVSVNDRRKGDMAARVVKACGGDVRDKNIAVLGLAFKPETDDMREAPSLPLIEGLISCGANVTAFDPAAMEGAKPLLPANVTFAKDAPQAVTGADVLVLVTEWNEFRALSPVRLKQLMRGDVIVDLRNVFDPKAMRDAGFTYQGIGRANEAYPEAAPD